MILKQQIQSFNHIQGSYIQWYPTQSTHKTIQGTPYLPRIHLHYPNPHMQKTPPQQTK